MTPRRKKDKTVINEQMKIDVATRRETFLCRIRFRLGRLCHRSVGRWAGVGTGAFGTVVPLERTGRQFRVPFRFPPPGVGTVRSRIARNNVGGVRPSRGTDETASETAREISGGLDRGERMPRVTGRFPDRSERNFSGTRFSDVAGMRVPEQ